MTVTLAPSIEPPVISWVPTSLALKVASDPADTKRTSSPMR
jgi:hypothetical protein